MAQRLTQARPPRSLADASGAPDVPEKTYVHVNQRSVEQQRIYSIQQASVPGNEPARILDPVGALEQRLTEVPQRPEDPPENAQNHAVERTEDRHVHPPRDEEA